MRTKRLHQAYLETDKLIRFLKKRDWCSADDLMRPLDRAEDEIERVVNQAIDDVQKMLAQYAEETNLYSENRIPGTTLNKGERAKCKTELKCINKTKLALLELRF